MAKHTNPISFGEAMRRRIMDKLQSLEPGAPALRKVLADIGQILETEIKGNIRDKGILDEGSLLESIRSFISSRSDGMRLRVGSYGIVYAAFHEFGSGDVDDRQRAAMFARLREEGKIGNVNKGLLTGNSFTARPYIRPAIKNNRKRITQILKEYARRVP